METGHPRREDVESAIEDLCRIAAMTLADLAALFQRNPTYLRHTYLRPLVEQGRLCLRYPNAPNHPQQACRTVSR